MPFYQKKIQLYSVSEYRYIYLKKQRNLTLEVSYVMHKMLNKNERNIINKQYNSIHCNYNKYRNYTTAKQKVLTDTLHNFESHCKYKRQS